MQGPEQPPDPSERVSLIKKALESDPPRGGAMALEFLSESPPLFFAQEVVEAIDLALGRPCGYDPSEGPDSPVNSRAAAVIRKGLGVEGDKGGGAGGEKK